MSVYFLYVAILEMTSARLKEMKWAEMSWVACIILSFSSDKTDHSSHLHSSPQCGLDMRGAGTCPLCLAFLFPSSGALPFLSMLWCSRPQENKVAVISESRRSVISYRALERCHRWLLVKQVCFSRVCDLLTAWSCSISFPCYIFSFYPYEILLY